MVFIYIKKNKIKGIVFVGYLYYIDLEVNYGILEFIIMNGMVVFIEDLIFYFGEIDYKFWVEN